MPASDDLDSRGYVVMALLAVQFGLQPVLVRLFTAPEVLKSSTVLAVELSKFVLAWAMLRREGMQSALQGWTLADSIRSAGVPAFIYAFQNLLIQTAYQNLDGLTFNLINQTKILFTAVFLFIMMGKRQSWAQCCALAALFGASLLLASQKTPQGARENSFYYGILPVFGASLCSGLASTLSQISLQGRNRNSYLYSMELCVFSSLVLLVNLSLSEEGAIMMQKGFFRGWTWWSLLPIAFSGCGGILVGLVMKYAGGVRKGFSIMAGIVLTGFVEWIAFQRALTPQLIISVPVVILSTWVHIKYPWKPPVKQE
eukprot:m.78708 g.78708  ORF g.78708 m.78708 type:complete len:313 (+) comp17374_c0_seq2:1037-1975(+)